MVPSLIEWRPGCFAYSGERQVSSGVVFLFDGEWQVVSAPGLCSTNALALFSWFRGFAIHDTSRGERRLGRLS